VISVKCGIKKNNLQLQCNTLWFAFMGDYLQQLVYSLTASAKYENEFWAYDVMES